MSVRVPLSITADMVRTMALNESVCIRPVLCRVTDRATGESTTVPIACGSTRESQCPPCAGKARWLRMTQCAEGWHRDEEPPDLENTDPPPAVTGQPGDHDDQDDDDEDSHEDQSDHDGDVDDAARRVRSTRRRQDAADLPTVPVQNRTIGRTFTAPCGVTYRPSMFVTLTLPSYGKVIPGRGVPVNPAAYDYRRAALDALHFPRLVDRWVQNLRRCAGYKVQHFSAVEAQRRLAPHLHAALRGAIPRQTIRAVTKGTYLQLWWPPFERAVYVHRAPVWDGQAGCYRDPDTGQPLPTWQEALDALDADEDARPAHVMRFGTQVDIKGIDGGSPDAARAVRYLTKYLTKAVSETYGAKPDTDPALVDHAYETHIDRLHHELQYLPCSPDCANWLRYGVQPRIVGPGQTPGHCPSKAHDREHLGLGGRRVLVSRNWSGKTLTEHRADRATVVRQALHAAGIDAPEADRLSVDVLHEDGHPRYVWEHVPVDQREYVEVLVASVMQRRRWRAQYDAAKHAALNRDGPPVDNRSATTNDAATDAA
jgi:hypothetical protein